MVCSLALFSLVFFNSILKELHVSSNHYYRKSLSNKNKMLFKLSTCLFNLQPIGPQWLLWPLSKCQRPNTTHICSNRRLIAGPILWISTSLAGSLQLIPMIVSVKVTGQQCLWFTWLKRRVKATAFGAELCFSFLFQPQLESSWKKKKKEVT